MGSSSQTAEHYRSAISLRKKVLLFVGRLDKYKGIKYLINSLSILKRKDAILLIVGQGDERKNLENQVRKLNLKDNVKFLGKLDDKELVKVYNIADIFILPSINRQEVFGKVLIEAMACGTPVIATDLWGVREVVRNAGIIVKRKNSQQLASAINNLLANSKLRKKLVSGGIKKVSKVYNWDKIIKSTLNVYRKLSPNS